MNMKKLFEEMEKSRFLTHEIFIILEYLNFCCLDSFCKFYNYIDIFWMYNFIMLKKNEIFCDECQLHFKKNL